MRLLTAVWTAEDERLGRPYLEAGREFHRTDIAGMLCDGYVPRGTLFGEHGATWEVDKCGTRPMLVSDDGRVLWVQENGYCRLVDADAFIGG